VGQRPSSADGNANDNIPGRSTSLGKRPSQGETGWLETPASDKQRFFAKHEVCQTDLVMALDLTSACAYIKHAQIRLKQAA